jgi:hypothetical protein
LVGQEFPDAKAFVGAVNAILADMEKVTSERVFLEWMETFHKCMETSGEYVD